MKPVLLRRVGDLIKAAPNNYNRTKSAFGDYQFPAADWDARVAGALEKGYQPEIVASIEVREKYKSTAAAPRPDGHIDAERGVLKTLTTEYVVDCVTCQLVPIQRARFIGVSKGLPYWITIGEDIAEVNTIYPSVFGQKNPKDFPRSVKL